MTTLSPAGSGLAPARTRLANGATITVKETRKTPAVALNIAVRAGSICDPDAAPGAMNLLARTIDRGTAHRSADDIAEELDSRGISLSIVVNRHQLLAMCTCLADDFEEVFALVGEVLMEPSFPESELTTRQREVVTAIRQDQDNPAVVAVEALMAALYGPGHPYGRPQKGSIESVERISRDRLLALHAARFAPGELSAVVVGDVDAARVVEVADGLFGRWRRPAPLPIGVPPPPVATARRRIVLPMMNKAQADVGYGFTAIGRTEPAYYAYWLLNNVLGQYALGGRLGDSIREKHGMAYYVSSILDANVIPGPLLIRAGVSPANVDRAIAEIDRELAVIRTEGITLKELEDSRRYLVGAMPRALETNAGIASFLQTAEFFGLGLDYDRQLPALLHAVTLDDANAAARRTLDPDRATVVIAGPYQT
jgi:zinc protease